MKIEELFYLSKSDIDTSYSMDLSLRDFSNQYCRSGWTITVDVAPTSLVNDQKSNASSFANDFRKFASSVVLAVTA